METKNNIPRITLAHNKSSVEGVKITDSEDAAKFCRQFYHDDINIFESLFIALIDNGNKTIGWAKISQGGIVGTVVDVRIIARYCLQELCTAVILCHNHPSGNIYPSEADKVVTERTKKALELIDVNVIDHIILTEDAYYSFADDGKL